MWFHQARPPSSPHTTSVRGWREEGTSHLVRRDGSIRMPGRNLFLSSVLVGEPPDLHVHAVWPNKPLVPAPPAGIPAMLSHAAQDVCPALVVKVSAPHCEHKPPAQ